MKKIVFIVSAMLVMLPAAAQVEDKLNFEVPLFGLTVKNVKPQWSLVAFGEVNLGYSYALHVPEYYYTYEWTTASGESVEQYRTPIGLHSGGIYGAVSLLELRYRPWRDGNLFMLGLNYGFESRSLPRRTLFDNNNEPVRVAHALGSFDAAYSERMLSLELGFVRESGDWSFGIQLQPGLGYSQYKNLYSTTMVPVVDGLVLHGGGKSELHADTAITNVGFRFGAKAAVWYRKLGAFVSVHPSGWSAGPEYTTISTGLTIRY